jgi:3-hydroxyacyl-CoA dehydrogenase
MAEIKTVAVLGCGLMGSGIAEISAKAGYQTWAREVTKEPRQRQSQHREEPRPRGREGKVARRGS